MKEFIIEKSNYLSLFWMILIFIGSSIPSSTLPGNLPPDYVSHFLEYFVLGFFINTWISTKLIKKGPIIAIILSILLCSFYGLLDEIYQSLIPGRVCDPRDWITDSIGSSIGAIVAFLFLGLYKNVRQ